MYYSAILLDDDSCISPVALGTGLSYRIATGNAEHELQKKKRNAFIRPYGTQPHKTDYVHLHCSKFAYGVLRLTVELSVGCPVALRVIKVDQPRLDKQTDDYELFKPTVFMLCCWNENQDTIKVYATPESTALQA